MLAEFIAQLDALNRALLLLYLDERGYREIAESSASVKPTYPPRSIDSRNACGAMENRMELDEFKLQWQEMDRKLDRSIALNLRLLTEKRTRRSKLRLAPMLLLQPVQIVIGLA